jgi:hypothetical protein
MKRNRCGSGRGALGCAAALMLLAVASCAQRDQPAQPGVITSDEPYTGPPVRASVTDGEALVEVTVPTGGWSFKLDSASEIAGGEIELFFTLEAPAADEFVTQALVTHSETVDRGERLTLVRAWVRQVTRGEQPPHSPPYRLAATSGSGAR